MHKVYYDKNTKVNIVDVSGIKPLEKIEAEFGKGDWQIVELEPKTEQYNIDDDGVLYKETILPPVTYPPKKTMEELIAEEVAKQLATKDV